MNAAWTLEASVEHWPLLSPFVIANYIATEASVVKVTISDGLHFGHGEAAGVFYRGESTQTLLAQIEAVRTNIEASITHDALRALLPAGGARNAIDCALWDLQANRARRPVWEMAGLSAPPRPLLTTFTLSADTPERMAQAAIGYTSAKALKLKLLGDGEDAARVATVRAARPDAWVSVDANQSLRPDTLAALLPTLVESHVELIEQPFPVGQDSQLDAIRSPIPLAADESAQSLADLDSLIGHYQTVNIKLDKCGGLSEALLMAQRARQLGLVVMVGNMGGTSLAMLPAMLVGQFCNVVDLDGPLFLKRDREPSVVYENGQIVAPVGLWGDRHD
jgi:L-alanine-DL-glutamate epimerase-like enolase superfamily enzyme